MSARTRRRLQDDSGDADHGGLQESDKTENDSDTEGEGLG